MIVFGNHVFGGGLVPGHFGVTVFFFLSGYVITTLLRVEFEKCGKINIAHFWIRRALRILPPAYLVILTATALAAYIDPAGIVYPPNVAGELLFYANYQQLHNYLHPAEQGLGVVWSLAVEEQFYLLFPLMYAAAHRMGMGRRSQAWTLWLMCAAVLIWRCVLVIALHADSERVFFATDTRIDSILFGCALAIWRNPALDEPIGSPALMQHLLLPFALIALLLCAYSHGSVFTDTLSLSIEGIALTVVFMSAVRFYDALPFRPLNSPAFVFIGTLSYSLYLVHGVILGALLSNYPHSHSWQRAPIGFGASLAVAWVIFQLVEKPCARLRRRLAA
jgi:peptidoglycan/LPS O-acetylase OafA/YrhL